MGFSNYSILLPPYVALTKAQPIADITFLSADCEYGTVDAINYNGFTATVGESYMFRKTDAMTITAGGTNYFIIEEKKLVFQGVPLL